MLRLNGRNVAEFVPEIADNLTTNDSTKALSAKQGKVLNNKIDSVNARLVSTFLTYDSDLQRFKLQSGVPYPAILQLCLVGRNTSTGAIYVVWYDATNHNFWLGATISGNAPTNGQNVNVQYFTTE